MRLVLKRSEIPAHLLKFFRPIGWKAKDEIDTPEMLAEALREDGWYRRQTIIWHKPNPMPESVTDRCTKSHEYVFMLSKSARYYYDHKAIQEAAAYDGRRDTTMKGSLKLQDGQFLANGNPNSFHVTGCERWQKNDSGEFVRNRRSVWTVSTKPYSGAHFATFPPELIKPCILAGCPAGGAVLDPFAGSGTTGKVALENGRSAILCELNPAYVKLIEKRCQVNLPLPLEAA